MGAACARTRRSLGHHLLHQQNFDRSIFIKSFYVQLIFLVDLIKESTIFGKESLFITCLLTFEQIFFSKCCSFFMCNYISTILGNKTVSTETFYTPALTHTGIQSSFLVQTIHISPLLNRPQGCRKDLRITTMICFAANFQPKLNELHKNLQNQQKSSKYASFLVIFRIFFKFG